MTERLIAVAIKRDGQVSNGIKGAHWQVRAALGDETPSQRRPGDEEGFLTSDGRFVGRREAHAIAVRAGQTSSTYAPGKIDLLSSEVAWD